MHVRMQFAMDDGMLSMVVRYKTTRNFNLPVFVWGFCCYRRFCEILISNRKFQNVSVPERYEKSSENQWKLSIFVLSLHSWPSCKGIHAIEILLIPDIIDSSLCTLACDVYLSCICREISLLGHGVCVCMCIGIFPQFRWRFHQCDTKFSVVIVWAWQISFNSVATIDKG